MNTLYLFTGQYPYSQYVECFLEDEINYLSNAFEKIVIIPTRGATTMRAIPDNCEVKKPVFRSIFFFLLKGLFNKRTFTALLKDFFHYKVYLSLPKFFVWVKGTLVINNLLNSEVIQKIEESLDENDVCYYYWGKWSNLLALFFKTKCHHVSRFHGAWDLWEEEFDNYAPLRKELVEKLDKSVLISRKGEIFFNEKYPFAKTSFNPLGSADYGLQKQKLDNKVKIVSCSTVYPLKRVDLIFQSILLFSETNNRTIEWTHIGGGPSFKNLQDLVASNSHNRLDVTLLGNLSHNEVIEHYKNNSYDTFVNLSTNEGVPVSIMEAISFGIPVLATAVGGTPEIVTNKSGILVSSNPTPEEVANALSQLLATSTQPRDFWEANYCAAKNYGSFSHLLKNISLNGK